MNKLKLPDFLIIPGILVEDSKIKPLDERVYAIVYWYSKLKLEKCIVSNKTIAKMLKSSSSSIANAISRLRNGGYIETTYDRPKHKREIIPTITYEHFTTRLKALHQGVKGIAPGGDSTPVPEQVRKKGSNKNNLIRTLKDTPPIPPYINGELPKILPPRANRLASLEKYSGTKLGEIFTHYLSESGEKRTLFTPGRKAKLRTRLKNFTPKEIKTAITNCFNDSFFSGQGNRGWRANIDYILRSDEILEKLLLLKPKMQQSGSLVYIPNNE